MNKEVSREPKREVNHHVVITGAGSVLPCGVGREALVNAAWGGETVRGSLRSFPSARHLSEPKMMKAVSTTDGFALAAVENLKKSASISENVYDPGRVGVYVGASAAFVSDNSNYMDAVSGACDSSGNVDMVKFGMLAMDARPNTLLVGLPNNVLCYASMIIGAKGPNSNYTSLDLSGHRALTAAAQRVRSGKIDLALAGAFGGASEKAYLANISWLTDSVRDHAPSDGAVFFFLESAAGAKSRQAQVIAELKGWGSSSSGTGLVREHMTPGAVEHAVDRALAQSSLDRDAISLVLLSSTGSKAVDDVVDTTLSRVFAKRREYPALGDSTAVLGTLVESAGLVDVILGEEIVRRREVPALMRRPQAGPFTSVVSESPSERTVALVLRPSLLGECSALVLSYERNLQ